MKPGRRSTASIITLAAISRRPKLTAPATLTTAERSIFDQVTAISTHLTPTDMPLLVSYCQATCRMHRLGRRGDINEWEKVGRLTLALAPALRLTAQSSIDPVALGGRKVAISCRPVQDHGNRMTRSCPCRSRRHERPDRNSAGAGAAPLLPAA